MIEDEILFKDGSIRKFDADIDQALAWKRLIDGKDIRETDILFLRHELLEAQLMREQGMFYEKAHEIANQQYNWEKAIEQIIDTDELY